MGHLERVFIMAPDLFLKARWFVFVFAAATVLPLLPVSTRPALAAPDNTRGMALMGAVVFHDGSLVRGIGVTGSAKSAQGQYDVNFDRDVSECIYQVTLQGSVNHSAAALPGIGDVNAVRVWTATGNTLTDASFYLTVFCGE